MMETTETCQFNILSVALRGLLTAEGVAPVVIRDASEAACAMAAKATDTDEVFCYDGPTAGDAAAQTDALRAALAICNTPPRIVALPGAGALAVGSSWQNAEAARKAWLGGEAIPAGQPLAPGRVAGKVAVVTGGAQGFGLEIAQGLVAQGAHVVLADINAEGARAAADALSAQYGPGRAMAVVINVSQPASIAQALAEVVDYYGGFDVFVANAGVLRAGSVKELSERDFDFVTNVNYKGYFFCVQQAARILAVQHLGCPSTWTDIIQINSKSGLEGSKNNGAYAGGKFGGIGLTQSFALELIENGIKINAICPGNFFDGPLWSDPKNGLFVQYLNTNKVPGAKTVEDVKHFYEAKVPMGRGCRTADVLKAVMYIIDQAYETGQAVPVTGGQVMLH